MDAAAASPTRSGRSQDVLAFRGGIAGLFTPFAVMFAGILWLGIAGIAIPEAYWPVLVLALFVGLVLARDQRRYVQALVAGISSSMLAVMLLAWFLAGILGQLLGQTGIVEGLVWVAASIGLPAPWFPLITFLIACGLSLSTGTSIGTIVAVTPILFPAGFALGADPLLLVGAIIGGGYFGDNLAPVSDTTIVSAYTQGTEVDRVVRSRMRYAAAAVAVTVAAYVMAAVWADTPPPRGASGVAAAPGGLIMLLVPALLIGMMLRGRELVQALLYTLVFGVVLGLATGRLEPADLLVVDRATFEVGGVVVSGIQSMVGLAVFTILLMGLSGTLEAGGMIQWLIERAERFATSVRRAELAIVGSTLTLNALTAAGTPSMVILGPFVRRFGHRFRIAPWRRGNLLDASSTSLIGFLPYSVAVLIPFAMTSDTVSREGVADFTPVHVVPYVFYCWALLFAIVAAAATGWGLELMSDEAYAAEARELYGGDQHAPASPRT